MQNVPFLYTKRRYLSNMWMLHETKNSVYFSKMSKITMGVYRMICSISKGLEIVITQIQGKYNNIIQVDKLCLILKQLVTKNSDIDINITHNILSILTFIEENKKTETININEIILRANRLAHQEWVLTIHLYHFITAIAFITRTYSKEIEDYINNELMYIPIESKFGQDDIVNKALIRPVHVITRVVDELASLICIHDQILVTGDTGVGKQSTILALIKSVIFRKYPFLYNSVFLINPSTKTINHMASSYRGARIIVFFTSHCSENAIPKQQWEGLSISSNLKIIYILSTEELNTTGAVHFLVPYAKNATGKITITQPEEKDIVKIIETYIHMIKTYIDIEIDNESLNYIIQASNRFEGRSIQPTKTINLLMEAIFDQINTMNDETIPISLDTMSKETATKALDILKNTKVIDILQNNTKKIILNITNVEKFIIKKYNLSNEILASMMSSNIREHLLGLQTKIKGEVFGQDEAVTSITNALWRRALKLDAMQKPTSFMFIGSTGCGKTWCSKVLAKYMHGDERSIKRFDMSEYMERHEVSKLIGSPPGYVGSNQPGKLTEEVINNPYAIILLDEIEKAHRDILNIFLQVLDDGRLTDNHGRTADFSKTIIIMTSNIGVEQAYSLKQSIGLGNTSDNHTKDKKDIMRKEADKYFKPEFLNRIDKIIIFNSLQDADFQSIIKKRLQEISNTSTIKVSYNNIDLLSKTLLDMAKENKKYNINKYNAREIKRFVVDTIEEKIIDRIIQEDIKHITFDDNSNIIKE